MLTELYNNNHSVFSMNYHLILVVKYRRNVIDNTISERLLEIFSRIAPSYNIDVEEWNHDRDHVHVLFRAQPNSELSKFINAYKSASSRRIFLDYFREWLDEKAKAEERAQKLRDGRKNKNKAAHAA